MQATTKRMETESGQAGLNVHSLALQSSAEVASAAPSVTPGSLADQYNREANGLDPVAFFYPYGF